MNERRIDTRVRESPDSSPTSQVLRPHRPIMHPRPVEGEVSEKRELTSRRNGSRFEHGPCTNNLRYSARSDRGMADLYLH